MSEELSSSQVQTDGLVSAGKHTPGPWTTQVDTSFDGWLAEPNESTGHATWYHVGRKEQAVALVMSKDAYADEELAANAALICAAPDFLAAAIEVVAADAEPVVQPSARLVRAIGGLRLAIAKATGGAA